jgi:hypothetical protein
MTTNDSSTMTPTEARDVLEGLLRPAPADLLGRYMQALSMARADSKSQAETIAEWGKQVATIPEFAQLNLRLLNVSFQGGAGDPVSVTQMALITGIAVGYLAGRDEAQREQLEQLLSPSTETR